MRDDQTSGAVSEEILKRLILFVDEANEKYNTSYN